MASPDGLRLYFGNRLPPEVLDIIFQYGFHLWLAKPYSASTCAISDRTRGFAHIICEFHTTIMHVGIASLSATARELVGWREYTQRIKGAMMLKRPARPTVFSRREKYIRSGNEWYIAAVDLDDWNPSRFVEDEDDDDI